MAIQDSFQYDAFVSYHPAHEEWVFTYLLPRLEADRVRVITSAEGFEGGGVRVLEIEKAIRNSRCTVAIITPAWLQSYWNDFEIVLSQTLSPADLKRKVIPVLLQPGEVPARLGHLVVVDLTNEKRREQRVRKLAQDIFGRSFVPAPALPRAGEDWRAFWPQLGRWLRRYRGRVTASMAGAILIVLLLLMALQLPPFQPRMVWLADPGLAATDGKVLFATGSSLVVGADNSRRGCDVSPKGLWHRRPDGSWQESAVGDALCIADWSPAPALADVYDLASQPDRPDTVFALTSHNGVLISEDAGASFHTFAPRVPGQDENNLPAQLAVTGGPSPALWVALSNRGVWRYQQDGWHRLDGQGDSGCHGLPEVKVSSLLIHGASLLMGTDQQGLWLSEDGGQSCRQVFDHSGMYEFVALGDISPSTHGRFLILLYDKHADPYRDPVIWQLLDLCPQPTSCNSADWQAEPQPLWQHDGKIAVEDFLAQADANQGFEWYLTTEWGQIWHGQIMNRTQDRLPGITRCRLLCTIRLAPSGQGQPPYLLVASPASGLVGTIYHFTTGPWWGRLWP